MASGQQFCLRWNDYQTSILSSLDSLRNGEDFTDVTLACEGYLLQAHRVILSACSQKFKELLKAVPKTQYPVLVLPTTPYDDILGLLQFMYQGEVNIDQSRLGSFIKTAETFQIRGLAETSRRAGSECEEKSKLAQTSKSNSTVSSSKSPPHSSHRRSPSPPPQAPPPKKVKQSASRQMKPDVTVTPPEPTAVVKIEPPEPDEMERVEAAIKQVPSSSTPNQDNNSARNLLGVSDVGESSESKNPTQVPDFDEKGFSFEEAQDSYEGFDLDNTELDGAGPSGLVLPEQDPSQLAVMKLWQCRRPHTTSAVWEYYRLVNSEVAACLTCGRLVGRKGGSTKGMRSHAHVHRLPL